VALGLDAEHDHRGVEHRLDRREPEDAVAALDAQRGGAALRAVGVAVPDAVDGDNDEEDDVRVEEDDVHAVRADAQHEAQQPACDLKRLVLLCALQVPPLHILLKQHIILCGRPRRYQSAHSSDQTLHAPTGSAEGCSESRAQWRVRTAA
jgi:hypothetical protein